VVEDLDLKINGGGNVDPGNGRHRKSK